MHNNSQRDRALIVRGVQALARIEEQDGEAIAPAVSIYETPDAFLVTADIPGADKRSIELRAVPGRLTIRASIVSSSDPHRGRIYARAFVLTDGIEYAKAEAEFSDGVLTVRLPKTIDAQRRDIPIRGEDAR